MPSIKKWIIEKATLVSPAYMQDHVSALKRICQGVYFLKNKDTKQLTTMHIPNWQPKRPERITLEQFQEYIAKVRKHDLCTNNYRVTRAQ